MIPFIKISSTLLAKGGHVYEEMAILALVVLFVVSSLGMAFAGPKEKVVNTDKFKKAPPWVIGFHAKEVM